MNDTVLNLEVTPAQMVAEYITLRDAKKNAEERFSEFMKENYGTRMEELELKLLDLLNKTGGDSLATPRGTVYKALKTSVTVADGREFRRHIIGEELWDLIEWRPAKTAINELVEGGDPLPPGLNRTVFKTVNIRRKQ